MKNYSEQSAGYIYIPFSLDVDCSVLPISMNGNKFEKGCPGAVWSNGVPARAYCENKNGQFSWWQACCAWIDGRCISGNCV